MTLMRFDPLRELDRLAEQTMSVGARALHSMPMEALGRGDEVRVRRLPSRQEGDEASKPRRVILGSSDRPSDAPNVVAGSAPAQEAAAAAIEPATVQIRE